jgi:thioredoxin-like negative regulator of GroEL
MLQIIEKMVDVEIGKINLNYNSELAKQLEIESVPCLIFIKNGEIVDTIYAFQSVPYLYEKLKHHFN